MPFKKYNSSNNAIAALNLPLSDTDTTMVLKGNYGRFSTSNFIVKVTKKVGGVVTARENIFVETRTGATCTGLVRAYEPVPVDDSAATNVQQPLEFDTDDVVEQVISAEFLKDMQENLGSKEGIQNQSYSYVADTGSANAYVMTLVPAVTAYVTGQKFSFKAANSNSGTSTLNVNGLGVKTIKKTGGTSNLASGDIVAGQIVEVVYDGTDFELQTPVPVTIPTDSFILSESCASGDALTTELIPFPLAVNTHINFGNETGKKFQAVRMIGNGVAMSTLSIVLKKVLSPADNCIIAIQADSSGSPSGVDLATATIAGGTITTSNVEYNPTLSATITPTDGAYYWVVCRRSGALDASNYYQLSLVNEETISFPYKTNNAGAWGSNVLTATPVITANGFYNEVAVRAKATIKKFANVRFYAPSALSALQRVSKSISDIYTGLSSLKVGRTYYLSNTAGAVSLTAGTVKSFAGVAKSPSSMLLPKRIVGNAKVTTTDSTSATSLTAGTTYFTNMGGHVVLRESSNGYFYTYARLEYSSDNVTWVNLGEINQSAATSGGVGFAASVSAYIEPGFYRVQHYNGSSSFTVTANIDLYEYTYL